MVSILWTVGIMPRWNRYYLYGLKIDSNLSKSRWCQFQICPYNTFDTFETVQMNRIKTISKSTNGIDSYCGFCLMWQQAIMITKELFWVGSIQVKLEVDQGGHVPCIETRWILYLSLKTIYFEHFEVQGVGNHMRSSRGGRRGTSGTTAARSSTLWNSFVT